jgi:hypothetical protein
VRNNKDMKGKKNPERKKLREREKKGRREKKKRMRNLTTILLLARLKRYVNFLKVRIDQFILFFL